MNSFRPDASSFPNAVVAQAVSLMFALLVIGCAEAPPEPSPPPPAPSSAATPPQPLDPDDPSILVRPFTAEQIRDAWSIGLTVTSENITADGVTLERWRVVDADIDGVDMEYATLAPTGDVLGAPRVERATWVGLRNHATFKAASAERQDATRDTPFGTLDGWLYTVRDAEAGTVTEMFFARDLPGAPVEMRMTGEDGEIMMAMRQLERVTPQ